LLLVSSCGGKEPVPIVTDDGGVVEPSTYADPLVELARMPGSTFVEITEVRARADGTVFFCSGVDGLNVVDATNPAQPSRQFRLSTNAGGGLAYPRCQHVAFNDEFVFMANKGDEVNPAPFVAAFREADGNAPPVAVYLPGQGTVEGIAAAGNLVYVAAHDSGLRVIELVGDAFIERGSVSGLTNAWAVALSGDTAYVADGVGGLRVVDITDPDAPTLIGSVSFAGAAQSVEVDDDAKVAYLAAGQGGLIAVDVSTPSSPEVVSVSETPGTALQVALDGNHAYVADWNDFRVFDVSDPGNTRLVATKRVDTGGSFSRVLGIGAFDGHAFVGEWTGLYSYRLDSGALAPDIWVSDREIEFGSIGPGDRRGFSLVLSNEGRQRLVMWSIDVDDARFSISDEQLILEPGETDVVQIAFDSDTTSQVSQSLTLRSDDPDEAIYTVKLSANRPGLGVGDLAPEVLLEPISGGEWRLSDQLGSPVLLAYFATF
jgi:hypothetical protein